ncbi:sugar transferase [Pseudoalteromonas rubra]|uniref:Sugar transferase n=1 Tax=Pseudoalteromonas rubra TaxID=43658 RepID=A0A5S3WSN6_9GAMM|nr:sugar transferase [Pseudoalteromonas rubra]TMP31442.1 sugar transferase [Pseudoalteromonas rubra]TMP34527.1 sugar transferase [Pseudoalteromonas rubra]
MYKKFGKRLFDIVCSIVLLVLISPLLLLISFIVLITMGKPIFFVQQRVGRNGIHFGIIKFRTMINGAEKQGTGLDSYADDPRVTKFGKFLRDSSLDELPQAFNILKGDMSFVGPRPPVTYSPYKYNDYPEHAKRRFIVKPGVTGLAQINGRNGLNWEQKFRYDNEYVKDYSFLKDLNIIIKTAYKVLINEGGYDNKKEDK